MASSSQPQARRAKPAQSCTAGSLRGPRAVVLADHEPAPPSPASRLGLTASQAARHLGVSISTVRRWSDAGHLQGYRTPGGQRRFSVEQLDAFLDSLRPRVGLTPAHDASTASFIRRSMSSSRSKSASSAWR